MGNNAGKNAAEAAKYGDIYLDLQTDTFLAGDMVQGTVYLNIKQPFPGDKLCLKVKGREYTRWVDYIRRQRTVGTGNNARTEYWTERVVRQQTLDVLNQEILIYAYTNGTVLNPGQFSFPISFRIPEGLPGSFFFGLGETTADISYEVEAFIATQGKKAIKLKNKRALIIREPVKNFIQTREVSINKNVITGCCCCKNDKGPINVKTMFEKDAYTPTEVARIMTEIDNSQCQANIKDINFSFRQTLQLRGGAHSKFFNFNVAQTSLGNVLAGQSFVGSMKKEASIQLPPMINGSYKAAKSGGFQSFGTDHTQGIAPSANGTLIQSNYILSVVCQMDGCFCCENQPSTSLPVQIYGLVANNMARPQPPANWQPQVMPPVVLAVNYTAPPDVQQNISINMNAGGMPQQQQVHPEFSSNYYQNQPNQSYSSSQVAPLQQQSFQS